MFHRRTRKPPVANVTGKKRGKDCADRGREFLPGCEFLEKEIAGFEGVCGRVIHFAREKFFVF